MNDARSIQSILRGERRGRKNKKNEMVNLDKETIQAVKEIEKALEKTAFEINRFEVSDTAIDERTMIELDIRKIVPKSDGVPT